MYMYLSVLVSACEVFEDLSYLYNSISNGLNACAYISHILYIHVLLSDVT